MTTTVLAYFPSPAQGVWYLGPIPIRAYALCIITGIIVALMLGDRRWAARGGERGVIYDIALWAVPFGLIGGRIYHLMTDWKTYFGSGGAGLSAALRIWEGGLGIWGAVAFGGVGAWSACRRRGIPLPAFGDAIAPGIVLAQAIGRLGNYFNQELYGRETTVPWGMEVFYRRDSSGVVDVHSLDGVSTGQVAAVVHPTFLYELLWNVLVFLVLIWADRKFRLGHGRLFALYVAGYCAGRFWVELMRDDTATLIAGIRVNVFTATFVFIGAVVYMVLAPKGREDPASLRGKQPPEVEAESAVEEWAEDLVAAAKGSGIVAAAAVAGEYEGADAEAVGDVDAAGEVDADAGAEFVAEVEAEEQAVEAQLEEEISEAEEQVASEKEEAEAAAEAESEAAPEPEAEVESEPEVEAESAPEVEAEPEPEAAAKLEPEGEPEPEAEVEVESAAQAESEAAPEPEAEVESEPEVEAESAPEVEAEPEPEAAAKLEPEGEPEAEAEVEPAAEAESEAAPEPEAEVESEPEVEPEPGPKVAAKLEPEAEPEPEVEVQAAVAPEPEPESADGQTDQKQPGFASTLRRLLWGVNARSGD
ncbi:prolipoprotein diacylglyceryl transferase [Mycolicibacterium sp.]|uniref:prolipoprotein diacylglyceryl transferase n=1 Tax=Mycolicibacterium sp. TaxID=2320850 RepID=UPI0025D09FE3|nr:prolipoprotein diacylglyceryl transferase [Mycolicibacterium sp.]MCB9408107.1 prolipoprotein diacylglyceryl transferase [Mycolicibacterium sp.]